MSALHSDNDQLYEVKKKQRCLLKSVRRLGKHKENSKVRHFNVLLEGFKCF